MPDAELQGFTNLPVRLKRRVNKLLAERYARTAAWRAVPGPVVSFTFDDFPRSALTMGGRILADHGCAGTYYAAMGLMGTKTAVGQMFERTDLDALLSEGHELACHTFDHVSCLAVPGGDFLRKCAENRQAVASMLAGLRLRNFSFPFGDVRLGVKFPLHSAYTTSRTIEPGLNVDPVDLAFLRANRLYSGLSLEPMERLICTNARRAGWLIFYTHDVAANPSPYGCTPAYFDRILRCALDSGAEILTVQKAFSRFHERAYD